MLFGHVNRVHKQGTEMRRGAPWIETRLLGRPANTKESVDRRVRSAVSPEGLITLKGGVQM